MSKGRKKRQQRAPREPLGKRIKDGARAAAWVGPWPLEAKRLSFEKLLAEAKRLDVVEGFATGAGLAATVGQPDSPLESPEKDWRGRAKQHLCVIAKLLEEASVPEERRLIQADLGQSLDHLMTFLNGYLMGVADAELTRTVKTAGANRAAGARARDAVIKAARPLAERGKTMAEAANIIANRTVAGQADYAGCPADSGTVANILSAGFGRDGWERLQREVEK